MEYRQQKIKTMPVIKHNEKERKKHLRFWSKVIKELHGVRYSDINLAIDLLSGFSAELIINKHLYKTTSKPSNKVMTFKNVDYIVSILQRLEFLPYDIQASPCNKFISFYYQTNIGIDDVIFRVDCEGSEVCYESTGFDRTTIKKDELAFCINRIFNTWYE